MPMAAPASHRPAALGLIPARFASTRLPGKPLLDRTGKTLIQHVVENARRCSCLQRVVVATDDVRIRDAVVAFGGEAVMTGEHPNGTSRLAEALTILGDTHAIIVNVQGDEPEVEPALLDALVQGMADDPDAAMATLYAPFGEDEDPANPNIVKVIKDQRDRALYFSRSLIPFDRDGQRPQRFKHPGLYAYRRDFLLAYPTLAPTPLEEAEKLEQLRVLEHGYAIKLIAAPPGVLPKAGIDTPQQYDDFVARRQAVTHRP